MSTSVAPPPASPPASDAAVSDAPAGAAAWIEKLQRAVEAASAEARSAFFYYAGFGLYFTLAVAGTTHEDLLRGSTVTMPGLGIGMPIEGFYLFVPLLFVVFHVYALLQLVILARRIGVLKLALTSRRDSPAASGQQVLLSPFAISQRLFGEPRGLVPRTVLCVSIWLTLVLIPLAVLIATQIRFLPYHAESVTWAHRLYIAVEVVLLLLLWPAIIHPRGRSAIERLRGVASRAGRWRRSAVAQAPALFEIARRRLLRRWRSGWSGGEPLRGAFRMVGAGLRLGLVASVLFMAFVVATIPGEAIERVLLGAGADDGRAACSSLWRIGDWLRTVRLPDRRDVLCVTYGIFEAPETPLGLRRNIVARDANLVVSEPTEELIRELGPKEAWLRKGKGVDLRGRDLRFADLSGSDLRRADLRGANLHGAVLHEVELTASIAGDIPRSEVGACAYEAADDHCLTGLMGADLTGADLRYFQGWKVDLGSANLTGANLEEAGLANSTLTGAILQWARLPKAVLWGADLRAAVMLGVMAPGANLTCAKLQGTLLKDAGLQQSQLVGVDLDASDLRGSSIDQAILRASSDCDPENGSAQAVSLAWADLPEVALPLLGSEYALFHLKGIAGEQQPLVRAAEAMDPERVQIYELGLAKELTELACSEGQKEAEISAGRSLAEGIARRIAAEYRHQDSQTPEKDDVAVRDAYFVIAGFLLFGECESFAEVDGAQPRRTLDDLVVRELKRLRCLWIAQQDDHDGARETLLATWSKTYRGEERVAGAFPAGEGRRC